MTGWNTDISQAPRGRDVTSVVDTPKGQRMVTRFIPSKVILATKCGKVTLSHFIPDEDGGRWHMLAKGEEPVAWFAWPEFPSHLSASTLPAFRSHAASLPAPRGALSMVRP